MTATRFVISPALLSSLAGLVPGEKSPLSPLYGSHPAELTPQDRETLFQAGILDENGLTEPARMVLAALSEAPSFARLRLNTPTGYLDEAIHFTGEGAQTVGISNTPDGLVLSSPGDADAALENVRQFISDSNRPMPPWSVELLPIEMLTLAALLDLRRKAVLRAIVDQQPVVPPPGDAHSLVNAIQVMWGNPQWLTAAVQNSGAIPMAPSTPQIQSALAVLSQKKLVWQQNGNFYPEPLATQVADRFLLIGTLLTLDAGSANLQGRYTLTRQSWLQAGLSEMLHITQVQERMRLELVPPAAALEKIQLFLSTFDAIPAPHVELVDLSLVIQAGVGAGQVFPLREETVLGRSEQAQVRILDARASRRHAVIRKLNQGYQLSDAGSTNGTYLNKQLITTPVWLHEGDSISIGETYIKVFRTGEIQPAESGDRTVIGAEGRPPASEPVTPLPPQAEQAPQASPPAPEAGQPDAPAPDAEPHPVVVPPFVDSSETAIPLGPPEVETPVEPPAAQEAGAEMISPAEEAPDEPAAAQEPQPEVEAPQAQAPFEPAASQEPQPEAEAFQAQAPVEPAAPQELQPQAEDFQAQAPEQVCPNCGATVPAEARFCGACGTRLIE